MSDIIIIIRNFFFQQNDTKINDFDEGVLILEPFFWGNVIFKICFFCIKSHNWGREEFLWVASPDCNAAKLRIEWFSLFMLSTFLKAKADTLPGGAKQMENFLEVNCDFWDRNGKFWKWHCLRKTAIESKCLHQN